MFPFEATGGRKRNNRIYKSTSDALQKASSQKRKTESDKETKNAIQSGLFALRRANKNRRSQLHKATASQKIRIVNSKIPGVDYSRNDAEEHYSQNLQLGNKISKDVTTVMMPDYLVDKLGGDNYIVFDASKGILSTQPNKTSLQYLDQKEEQNVCTPSLNNMEKSSSTKYNLSRKINNARRDNVETEENSKSRRIYRYNADYMAPKNPHLISFNDKTNTILEDTRQSLQSVPDSRLAAGSST